MIFKSLWSLESKIIRQWYENLWFMLLNAWNDVLWWWIIMDSDVLSTISGVIA